MREVERLCIHPNRFRDLRRKRNSRTRSEIACLKHPTKIGRRWEISVGIGTMVRFVSISTTEDGS
jgi:hypothetical protein